jgi:hypothetical protein
MCPVVLFFQVTQQNSVAERQTPVGDVLAFSFFCIVADVTLRNSVAERQTPVGDVLAFSFFALLPMSPYETPSLSDRLRRMTSANGIPFGCAGAHLG